MRFRMLGPLEVHTGQEWTSIRAAKWRAVLARLLLSAGQVVATDTLIDELWGDDPPATATNLVSLYMLRLRRFMGDTDGQVIRTRSPGYQLLIGPDDLDVQRFTVLSGQGRKALGDGDPEAAARWLAEALALWRGGALADVPPSPYVEAEAERLDELRLSATELQLEAEIACGRHREVIPELRRLLADQPLREEWWLLLMRALDGAGRRAQALAAYEQARTTLADQLGVDPGRELQELFRQLLRDDEPDGPARPARAASRPSRVPPALAAVPGSGGDTEAASGEADEADAAAGPATPELEGSDVPPGSIALGRIKTDEPPPPTAAEPGPPAPAAAESHPMQLPADIGDFTGRELHVEQLCQLLAAGDDDGNPGAVRVALVAGAGGLGKTTLAVHAAHRMRSQYPDGVLYADLHGASPQPLPPAEVLARFLRDLGVRDNQIPVDEEQRAAQFRTRLNGRRIMLLLDNARDAAQVRSLLPGSASCAVIVTSRRRLADLVGGGMVHLNVLDDAEALALFSRIVGTERAAAEPDATAELLIACAGLPLAIRISAARLAAASTWTIRSLADEISDEHHRLDELKVGDLAVRASFEVSFSSLPGPAGPGQVTAADAFRTLGLWPGQSIGLGAAAALIGQPQSRVAAALDTLFDAHLLESPSPRRYQFHDLLRVYAAERAEEDMTPAERAAAIGRLLSWYVHTAGAASGTLSPHRYRIELGEPEAGVRPLTFTSADRALSWYETEQTGLIEATRHAARLKLDDAAWQIPTSVYSVLNRRGNWADCVVMHRIALASARRVGNRQAEAWVLNNLGEALARRNAEDAIGDLKQSIAIRQQIGDRYGEAQATNNLGDVYHELDRPEEALEALQRSLVLQEQGGYRYLEGIARVNLGDTFLRLDRPDEAIESWQRARAIFTELDIPSGEGWVLYGLGRAYAAQGRTEEALGYLSEALSVRRSLGDLRNQALTLRLIGEVNDSVGEAAAARDSWSQALVLFGELGDEAQAAELAKLMGDGPGPG
jgi:DNA-binding SARP family transcriptional activator